MLQECPERHHFDAHEDYVEAKDSCCEQAAKTYKKNFGKAAMDTAKAMMRHFDHEKEHQQLLEQGTVSRFRTYWVLSGVLILDLSNHPKGIRSSALILAGAAEESAILIL